MIHTLLNKSGVQSSIAGDVAYLKVHSGEGVVQVRVDGEADVNIEGRVTSNASWSQIDTASYTNSGSSTRVATFPQMRAVITSIEWDSGDDITSGGATTTAASGSITLNSALEATTIGADMEPVRISIPGHDAVASSGTITSAGSGWAADDTVTVGDGKGNTVVFMLGDTSARQSTTTILLAAVPTNQDTITITDAGGKIITFFFKDASTDTPNGMVGVDIGGSTAVTAASLQAAIAAEWVANRLNIDAEVSSSTVTLNGITLSTTLNATTPVTGNFARSRGPVPAAFTIAAWSGGVAPTNTFTTQIPVEHLASQTPIRDSLFRTLSDQIYRGNLETLSAVATSTTVITLTFSEKGSHNNAASTHKGGITGIAATSLAETGSGFTISNFASGTDGANAKLLEINETSPHSDYTLIDRINGEPNSYVLENITTVLNAATTWAAGTLTATNSFDNKTVTLKSAGGSLDSFGNHNIVIVGDYYNCVSVSGLSGGAAGCSVLVQLDVPNH